jgi:hypothetical protein
MVYPKASVFDEEKSPIITSPFAPRKSRELAAAMGSPDSSAIGAAPSQEVSKNCGILGKNHPIPNDSYAFSTPIASYRGHPIISIAGYPP